MMSITLEAASPEELVERLEKTLTILGRRVGAPTVIGEWTLEKVYEDRKSTRLNSSH